MNYAITAHRGGRQSTQPAGMFSVLDVADLRQAQHLSARADHHRALLKVEIDDSVAAPAARIRIRRRTRSIVSLIHDVSLLKIAVGLLFDAAPTDADLWQTMDKVSDVLAGLGYQVTVMPASALGLADTANTQPVTA